jgi:hypothetical protein
MILQRMLKSKSAISPILATLLIIVIAVAAIVVTYSWTTTYIDTAAQHAGFIPYKVNVAFSTDTIIIDIGNMGTSNGQVNQVYIGTTALNLMTQTTNPDTPISIATNDFGSLSVAYSWSAGIKYYFKIVTSSGAALSFVEQAPFEIVTSPVVTDCGSVLPTFSSGGFAKYRVLGTQNIWAGTVQSVNQTGATRSWINPGDNSAVFKYDSAEDSLVNTFSGYQVTYTSISQKTSIKPTIWKILVITIRNTSPDTILSFNNVSLGPYPLGSFTVTPSSTNYWTITGYNLSDGFTITGTIYLNGTFSGGSESNKILIEAGSV